MKRWSKIDMVAARKCGADGAVARDVIRRLLAGETVLARLTYPEPLRWRPVELVADPLRPRNPDGSDAHPPGYVPAQCYAVSRTWWVSASGGGSYQPHEYLVEARCGWLLDHYDSDGRNMTYGEAEDVLGRVYVSSHGELHRSDCFLRAAIDPAELGLSGPGTPYVLACGAGWEEFHDPEGVGPDILIPPAFGAEVQS